MEQIRWVFDDNWRIIFVSSPEKHTLWILIRIASNEYPQHMFIGSTLENYPLITIKHPLYLFRCCFEDVIFLVFPPHVCWLEQWCGILMLFKFTRFNYIFDVKIDAYMYILWCGYSQVIYVTLFWYVTVVTWFLWGENGSHVPFIQWNLYHCYSNGIPDPV